jgi:hypothetical protein
MSTPDNMQIYEGSDRPVLLTLTRQAISRRGHIRGT